MEEFQRILEEHRRKYPDMEPQDYGKLAYQSEFGPEHMVGDPGAALGFLKEEWAVSTGIPAMEPEDIGGGLCRYHLSACGEMDLAALTRAFCGSAQNHRGTRAGLDEKLALLKKLNVPGMEDWLREYGAAGCPPVRHSQTFRDRYAPHYRVILWDYVSESGGLKDGTVI